MLNRFFKRRNQQGETFSSDVHLNTLMRWYSYDSAVTDPAQLAKVLDLLPVSPEGEKQEMSDSSRRITEVAPLFAFATVIANINAKAIAGLHMRDVKEAGLLTDENELATETAKMADMYAHITFSGIVSALSSGVELGIIETNAVEGRLI